MPPEDINLLANVIQIAQADGKLTKVEQSIIETFRKDLGIKKGELSAAQKLVDSGSYTIKPVGSFSNQVRNLELALRVAYSDGDLGPVESEMVSSFAAAIGLSKEQLERMITETIAKASTCGPRCSSCGVENSADSKFCSKCGNNLSAPESEVEAIYEIPRSGITIEFAESTGASYPKALALAKSASVFNQGIKGKKTWHMANFPSGNITDALPLAEALIGLRNRVLYINGQEQPWDEVFSFAWCFTERAKAYRPVEYCFGKDENRINPWGCRLTRMEWSEWANWFCLGQWEKSGLMSKKLQWRFDKNRIKHELSTNVYRYRYCPHLNTTLFDLVLKGIPDVVVPLESPDWDYHQSYTEVPGAVKVVQTERNSGMTFTNEFWADGVRPKGIKVLANILINAFVEMKHDPGPIRALLK